MEDIVGLRFNPGQGVAQFKSAERGLSLLICRTRTPEEIERVRDKEAAEHLTPATRVLEEALKLQRGDPRAPASNYFELKLNITMFCVLFTRCLGTSAVTTLRSCRSEIAWTLPGFTIFARHTLPTSAIEYLGPSLMMAGCFSAP